MSPEAIGYFVLLSSEMPSNARFRAFLKFCDKELTKVVPGGVVGATLWKV